MPGTWENIKQGFHFRGDYFIVDAHCHVDCPAVASPKPFGVQDLIGVMDSLGIERACVNLSHFPDYAQANERAMASVRQYPKRLFGIAVASVYAPHSDVDRVRRCIEELGMRGIKVTARWDSESLMPPVSSQTAGLEEIYQLAMRWNCPVICHGYLTPSIARRYRDVQFILTHALEDWASAESYRKCENVHFDTSASFFPRASIAHFVKLFGAQRIVFGSDMPLIDPRVPLGVILSAGISEHDKERILGLNMARLLGLEAG